MALQATLSHEIGPLTVMNILFIMTQMVLLLHRLVPVKSIFLGVSNVQISDNITSIGTNTKERAPLPVPIMKGGAAADDGVERRKNTCFTQTPQIS